MKIKGSCWVCMRYSSRTAQDSFMLGADGVHTGDAAGSASALVVASGPLELGEVPPTEYDAEGFAVITALEIDCLASLSASAIALIESSSAQRVRTSLCAHPEMREMSCLQSCDLVSAHWMPTKSLTFCEFLRYCRSLHWMNMSARMT